MAELNKSARKKIERQNKVNLKEKKEKSLKDKSALKSAKRNLKKDFGSRSSQILGIILVIMLIAVAIRFAMGSESIPTFTGFLETLTSAPEINIPFLTQTTGIIMADWGIFNFIRDFINTLMQIVDVLIFFFNGILSVLTYVVYFFRWLFIV